jgi:hypothetical protein
MEPHPEVYPTILLGILKTIPRGPDNCRAKMEDHFHVVWDWGIRLSGASQHFFLSGLSLSRN